MVFTVDLFITAWRLPLVVVQSTRSIKYIWYSWIRMLFVVTNRWIRWIVFIGGETRSSIFFAGWCPTTNRRPLVTVHSTGSYDTLFAKWTGMLLGVTPKWYLLFARGCDALVCRLISNYKKETTGDGTLNPVIRLCAGAVAGIIAMSSTYHLDMIRGRLTVQEGMQTQYTGILNAYSVIIRQVRRCSSFYRMTATHTTKDVFHYNFKAKCRAL